MASGYAALLLCLRAILWEPSTLPLYCYCFLLVQRGTRPLRIWRNSFKMPIIECSDFVWEDISVSSTGKLNIFHYLKKNCLNSKYPKIMFDFIWFILKAKAPIQCCFSEQFLHVCLSGCDCMASLSVVQCTRLFCETDVLWIHACVLLIDSSQIKTCVRHSQRFVTRLEPMVRYIRSPHR